MKRQSLLCQLALLQMEQYDSSRYLEASQKDLNPELGKNINWTTRLRLTKYIAYVLGVYNANRVIALGAWIVEKLIYLWVKRRITMLKAHGLKVVSLAGSYGKTSVKYAAYELLRQKYAVIATPESFNTIIGIAKCLKWEVDSKTQIFLVEVGAYHIGDITNLLHMVKPDIGVLTGMAKQHLERFGSWENIQQAKSEIAEYMINNNGILIANGSDEAVRRNVESIVCSIEKRRIIWYGNNTAERNVINIEGAKQIAKEFGITKFNNKIRQVKNRFEMTTDRYGMRVIDDSFSSNEKSFVSALEYLQKQKQYTRILVTPGLVELGQENAAVHEQLGREIVGKADWVMLVGKNERTDNLVKGMGGKVKLSYLNKTLDFMTAIRKLKLKNPPLVLLENDVPENY